MIFLGYKDIVSLVSLGSLFLLLFILYKHGRSSPGVRAYGTTLLAAVGWIAALIPYRAHFMGETMLWTRLVYAMGALNSPTFLYFALTFPNKKISRFTEIFLLVESLFIFFLCFHPTYFIQGYQPIPGREDLVIYGPLYFIFVLHIILPFIFSYGILFSKSKKAVGEERAQIGYISLGYFVSSTTVMITNMIMPLFGNFEFSWLGQFTAMIVAVVTTYTILKHNLLNIKLVATEAFILFLLLFLVIQFLLSNTTDRLVINGVVLAAVLFISNLLKNSVRKEIERRHQVSKLAQSLEKANIQLKELDKMKTDFLSIAAHQLRTPMSIFNGYFELLKDGAYGNITKETEKVLSNMDESNQRLVKLVDNFLDITRLEQGRTKYDFKKGDLGKLAFDVVKELTDRAAQKKLKIVLKQIVLPVTFYDDEKIRQVMFNFIDNAIKYTEKGEVYVSVHKEKDGISFRVKDTGLGFNKIDEANFFQKFYRGDNVRATNVNGSGLGLYVCKMFIDAHRGRVWAHSQGVNRGSEFGFWVPIINNPEKLMSPVPAEAHA